MDHQGQQLLVAQVLVRRGQQRLPQDQIRDDRRHQERQLPTRNDRLRQAVAGALFSLGQRLAGSQASAPIVTTNPEGAVRNP